MASGRGCFASDSLITLADGQQKTMSELHSGDRVLAYNDQTKEIIATDVITMLDHQPKQFGIISPSCFSFSHFFLQRCSNN